MTQDFVLRGGNIVRPDQPVQKLDILVRDGKIAALMAPGEPVAAGLAEQSAHGLHVFPGLIDAHVHFGFGEKITEYDTETAYAAQGGFTTILGHFLNNEAYGDVFKREQEYATPRARVDYGFHFATANEVHIKEMESYVKDFGVNSFKFFMNFKGEEGRFMGLDGTDDGYFFDLMKECGRIGNVMMVCHTENIEIVSRVRRRVQEEGIEDLKAWARAKPAFTESEAAIRAMYFAEYFGARIYFPHISSRIALDEIRAWRKRYKEIYVEICPHYLTHTEDSELVGMGKANPPFRTADDRDALWEALADGTANVVASDHVPRKRATKDKSLWLASQGFPGTATILPVLLSEGYHKGRLSLERIAELLTSAPADLFDLGPTKGRIAVGSDADFALVDLELERVVKASDFDSYSDYSLYDGWKLKGWPVKTILRGLTVMDQGKVVGPAGYGQYLSRPVLNNR